MSLGAHCSIAKGVHNALLESAAIDGNATQIFTSNPRAWLARRPFDQLELLQWKEARCSCKIKCVISHASYLINLGSSNPSLIEKSTLALKAEILRCQQLQIDFLNFHPGSKGTANTEASLQKIVDNLRTLAPLFQDKAYPILLLETLAGQGNQLGKTFEEISFLIEGVKDILPIGVCIDTCHIFAAGYDLRSPETLNATLEDFARIVGLNYLQLLHLNDSVKALGSRVDRHAPIGKGQIGWPAFAAIMQHPSLLSLPKILETPGGSSSWEKEIKTLRALSKQGNAPNERS